MPVEVASTAWKNLPGPFLESHQSRDRARGFVLFNPGRDV